MADFLSFDGQIKAANICSVYDGDSFHATFDLHETTYKWKCRLSGVDTPEIRGSQEDVKQFAIDVRDKVRKKILGRDVKLHCGAFDKYGRLLVVPFVGEENICEWLVSEGYAKPYDGGKRDIWGSADIKKTTP